MQLIDEQLLNVVTRQAKESERLRMNFNFHDNNNSPSQRLLNALEPGTILPIHRHKHTQETYILLRGKLRVLFYDNDKNLKESELLDPLNSKYGVNIPSGQWHTIEVLESGTVILEVKDGPYAPITDEDIMVI